MTAAVRRLLRRLRSGAGFGMIELLVSTTVLSTGSAALLAAFQAGHTSLERSGRVATAAVMADQQLERYRIGRYQDVALVLDGVVLDPAYRSDQAFTDSHNLPSPAAADCPQVGPSGLCAVPTACALPDPAACSPIQASVVAPDGRTYRIDSYVFVQNVANGVATGRPVKVLTVVVRDTASPSVVYARAQTSIDGATG